MQEFRGKFDTFASPILEIVKVFHESSVSTVLGRLSSRIKHPHNYDVTYVAV